MNMQAVANALFTMQAEMNAAPKIKDGKINGNRLNKIVDKAKEAIKAAGGDSDDAISMTRPLCEPYIAGLRK